MKSSGVYHPVNEEETKFCRHIRDITLLGEKTFSPRFSGFLTEREQNLAAYTAFSLGVECGFWGGYEGAVRRMFSAPSDDRENYPFKAVTFFYRPQDKLVHRDFLGAIMSLGIKRDCVGDIVTAEGEAAVFVVENVLSLISTEIRKIGRVGVKQEPGLKIPIPEQKFEEISSVITSDRIDVLVAAACKISREKAASLIRSGAVTSGGIAVSSVSLNIAAGEVFSVKGYGKFIFSHFGDVTKKGKNHALIKKYL